jgi:RNA polymerase sigma factor (sigma-70 family)
MRKDFPSTHWSLVRLAADRGTNARDALEKICQLYWEPLYCFVRRQGKSPEEAQDITQSFFEYLISGNYFASANQDKGRLRSYLLGALKHFMAALYRKETALKRSGPSISIDLVEAEATLAKYSELSRRSPEELYERRWALMLLDSVVASLAEEYATNGKQELFETLSAFLSWNSGEISYRTVAESLQMSEGAVKVAVHRMRQRYRELIHQRIEMTLSSPAQVAEEIHHLMEVLR